MPIQATGLWLRVFFPVVDIDTKAIHSSCALALKVNMNVKQIARKKDVSRPHAPNPNKQEQTATMKINSKLQSKLEKIWKRYLISETQDKYKQMRSQKDSKRGRKNAANSKLSNIS